MKLNTFYYLNGQGWSVDPFPAADSDNTLVLVFGAPEFMEDQKPIREIRQAYPRASLVGCSTAGEIFDMTIRDHSLSVAVLQFATTSLATSVSEIRDAHESYQAGEALARELMHPGLKSVLVLSDGTHVNGSQLVRGLNAILPEAVIVTGGLAGDGERFERTWVMNDGIPESGCISAVGFYGENIRVGHGSKGGWDIFGPVRRVTRADENILYELDGKPALELYKEYLGDRAAGLPATALLFPLALRDGPDDYESVVRTVLGVDEEHNSMIFAGDIPQGSLAQLMKANFDRLIDGASEAALMTHNHAPAKSPVLMVAISCVGRRLVLGERTEEELEVTLENFPDGTRQIGFYSYGEISPHTTGYCDLHNQTMTLTTITEVLPRNR